MSRAGGEVGALPIHAMGGLFPAYGAPLTAPNRLGLTEALLKAKTTFTSLSRDTRVFYPNLREMALDGYGIRASEEEAREWADYFVLVHSTKAQKLHLPNPGRPRAEPFPYCGHKVGHANGEFVAKDLEVFPTGYKPICKNCRERLFSRLDR